MGFETRAFPATEGLFLGVESSATGRAWRDRLDARGAARALAIAQRHDLPELLARILAGRSVEIDAVEAFRTMRRENPRVKVVIVSAVPFEKTRRTMAEEGALAYIIKPFNKFSFDQVRQRLQRVFPELTASG